MNDRWRLRALEPSERLGGALALLAIVTLVTQILRCGAQTTQTETTLFGILQFVFSIGFAWVLARASCKREFQENQKHFAIAAYRRIREIEQGVSRLLVRIARQKASADEEDAQELDAIQEVARGIQATTTSSIADWADIIGDEIATVEKIERIRQEGGPPTDGLIQVALESSRDSAAKVNEMKSSLADSLQKMNSLLETLPASLQPAARKERDEKEDEGRTELLIWDEIHDHGSIVMTGFWSPEAGYKLDQDIRQCDPAQPFVVELEYRDGERGPLVLKDQQGHAVGRITNKYSVSSYDTFAKALFDVIGAGRIPVRLEEVGKQQRRGKRVYFRVRHVPAPEDTR